MQNQNLCRAKRIDNKGCDGEWVVGYYCYNGWTGKEKHYVIPDFASTLYGFEVDDTTVGRYTNRKEHTPQNVEGRKIFEGDRVRVYGGESAQGYWENDETIVVNLNDWQGLMLLYEAEYVEILGNIYDKPEGDKHDE